MRTCVTWVRTYFPFCPSPTAQHSRHSTSEGAPSLSSYHTNTSISLWDWKVANVSHPPLVNCCKGYFLDKDGHEVRVRLPPSSSFCSPTDSIPGKQGGHYWDQSPSPQFAHRENVSHWSSRGYCLCPWPSSLEQEWYPKRSRSLSLLSNPQQWLWYLA